MEFEPNPLQIGRERSAVNPIGFGGHSAHPST
jgi:hypothetical protein